MASHSSGLCEFPSSPCNDPGCTSIHGPEQAEINSTPDSTAEFSQPSTIPTNDNNALHSMINTLQAKLQATINANSHLTATVAHLQAEQAIPSFIPTTSTDTTAIPVPAPSLFPCQHPDHPCTIASGRGAASAEVFKKIIKTNWHGRLGRTHMVDVDALSPMALTKLDSLLRQKLSCIFPRGTHMIPEPATFFAHLTALGLRLEDRGGYADVPDTPDDLLYGAPFTRRGEDLVAWYYTGGDYKKYWKGVALETMMELAKYRGLFTEEGFLI